MPYEQRISAFVTRAELKQIEAQREVDRKREELAPRIPGLKEERLRLQARIKEIDELIGPDLALEREVK